MEKGISYLNRNFNDYRNSLLNYTKQYYPELEDEFNDASIGSWLLDIVANIGDNLSYHIDRVYQETNINSARERESVYALARNNGIKIPGPKASMAEVEFTCEIPVNGNGGSEMMSPNWEYAPQIKKGTKVSSGNQVFELMYDVDFNEQFNENGVSNRTITPKRDSNGFIKKYIITKTGLVSAGETKIYTKVITSNDIVPFMSFIIPDTNVMNIESIIFKDGKDYNSTPTMTEFLSDNEKGNSFNDCGMNVTIRRFFEVDYLSQQYRWGDYKDSNKNSVGYRPDDINGDTSYYITKGAWIPLRQKFITEFTDNGYLKVTFGAGTRYVDNSIKETPSYSDIIVNIMNNDGLGVLPEPDTTMYVMYRKGGGMLSNVPQGSITNITYMNIVLRGNDNTIKSDVKRSISVVNTSPSVYGKDMPSIEEMKYLIKYNNGAQNRCVTLKDYHDRLSKIPPRYGCPFRYGVTEENNKIMIYLLGIDNNGKLTASLPETLTENIQNYISEYRMINDYVEIKSGRIINLQFEVDIFIDKNYNTSDVITNVINCIKNYMDINKLQMGDDVFVGDIEKEVSKIDGVLNLIELRVYNIYGDGYSNFKTTQKIMVDSDCANDIENTDNGNTYNRDRIDLMSSDKMIFTENDTMFEIKNINSDIICRVKCR